MHVYIYIYCMYTNLKYFSFKDCKASRVERTSFTKAYRPRWWCQSRASWTFMWQAFHARSWSGGSSWSCRNTVPPPVIWWSVKYIVCTYTFQAWQNWLSTVLKTLTEDRWIVFRTEIDSRSQFVWTVVMTVSAGFLHLELQSSLSTGTTCFNFPWCRRESQQKHFAQQILTPSIALLLLPQKKLVAAVLEFLLGRAWECENGFNKVFWEVHWTWTL